RGRPGFTLRSRRRRRRRAVTRRRRLRLERAELRVRVELHVAAGAVDLLDLLAALHELLVAVPVARLHLEQVGEDLVVDERVALDADGADAVARALVHRHAQADPARLAVGRVLEHLDARLPDARL